MPSKRRKRKRQKAAERLRSASRRREGRASPDSGARRSSNRTQVASALLEQAVQLLTSGAIPQARKAFLAYTQTNPGDAFGWIGLADSLGRMGDLLPAIDYAKRGIAIDGSDARFHTLLADLLYKAARGDESLASARQAVALDQSNINAHCLIARNLEQVYRIDEAITHLRSCLKSFPTDGYLLVTLGHLEHRAGQLDEAERVLRKGLEDQQMAEGVRLLGLHELGAVLDRLERYDEAFEQFRACGEATKTSPLARPFDRQHRLAQIESYKAAFTPELLRRFGDRPASGEITSPSFLVGFPRSGTTLLEQVLNAHPQIATTGEQPILARVRGEWTRISEADPRVYDMLRKMDTDEVRHFRQTYWKAANELVGSIEQSPILIDKLPLNIIELGLINILFPDAKVIVALRDPRDVCLSCFFQNFRLNNAMIHFLSLEESAEFYAATMDLYLHQRSMLTLDICEVKYECAVADMECEARRMLEHLGVEWDEVVLRFHESARTRYIATPSQLGVTEKVYSRSVARWKNYEAQLAPALPHLERFVRDFGYYNAR